MNIRRFQPGDEIAQVGIYNEAAAELARFKPATLDEVRRRLRAPDFDPTTRLYATENNKPVAYLSWQTNGRISYPWHRKGHTEAADQLFQQGLETMRQAGVTQVFAAYRTEWTGIRDFFLGHGFAQNREVMNYVLDLVEMPTPAARSYSSVGGFQRADVPALAAFGQGVLRLTEPALGKYLFENPYFPPESLFGLRDRQQGHLTAAGMLIVNDSYADPKQVDSGMPCFRLGAFGTEGLTTKRINGMFSIVVSDPQQVSRQGLDLLGHAAFRLQDTELETLAAQVISDATHLVRFYKQYFRLQGRFPLFERTL